MRESVAEVEEGAAVIRLFLTLVVADHGGLEGAGAHDGFGLYFRIARDDRRAM